MKSKQKNDKTNRSSVFYAENETKLSWSIEPGAVYDKNQTGQWHDRSYSIAYAENETELLWLIRPGATFV